MVKMPIDQDFREKREKVDEIDGIDVWDPKDPPEKLGIIGTTVAVIGIYVKPTEFVLTSVPFNSTTGMIHQIIQNLREKPSPQEKTNVFNV